MTRQFVVVTVAVVVVVAVDVALVVLPTIFYFESSRKFLPAAPRKAGAKVGKLITENLGR